MASLPIHDKSRRPVKCGDEEEEADPDSTADILQTGLRQLLQEEICTDFEVVVDGVRFPCHKAVLAAVSDFFRAMFYSGMKETLQNQAVLKDIKPETFQVILDILYNKEQEPDGEIISELLRAARMLQMKFLEDICIRYLKANLDLRNCIEIWKMSCSLQCQPLVDESWSFILKNFEALRKDQMLVSLDKEEFSQLIEDEFLLAKDEKLVCKAVFSWIEFEKDKREVYCSELLQMCCLSQLTEPYLIEKVSFRPAVRKDDASCRLVKEAFRYKFHPGSHGSLALKLRESMKREQVTVLLGKKKKTGQQMTAHTLCHSRRKNDWLWLQPLRDVGEEFACCVHGSSIFVTGGTKDPSATFEYVGTSDKWESREDMVVSLRRHCMVATDGALYVLGGMSDFSLNGSVQRYDVRGDKWRITSGELIAPVEYASAAVLGHSILVFGGVLQDNVNADCIQVFNTKTGTGNILCHLPDPVGFSRALAVRDRGYVVTSKGDVIGIFNKSSEPEVIATIPKFQRKNFGLTFDSANPERLLVMGGVNVGDELTGPTSREIVVVDTATGETTTKSCLPFAYEVHGCVEVVISTVGIKSRKAYVPATM